MTIVMPRGEFADHLQHLGDELGVEGARDLVQQHQLRLHRQGSHDRRPLLLPAREPVRELVALVREAEAPEQLDSIPFGLSGPRGWSTFRGPSVSCAGRSCAGRGCTPGRRSRCRGGCGRRRRLVVTSWPATTIRPLSIGSRRFTQPAASTCPSRTLRSGTRPRARRRSGRSRAAPRSSRTTCAGPRQERVAHAVTPEPADGGVRGRPGSR